MDDKVVLWKDAATRVEATVWRDAKGGLHLEERSARFCGCTHVECAGCGKAMRKGRTLCNACYAKHWHERYAALPREPWDGSTPVCEFNGDRFFWSWEDITEHCVETGTLVADLLLVHCKALAPPSFDVLDFLCDWLPEDTGSEAIPQSVSDAAKALNIALATMVAMAWVGRSVAVSLDGESCGGEGRADNGH